MSTSLALRHARQLSTAAAGATAAKSKPITISKAKAKLRWEFDPDKALKIYASVSNHYVSPLSSRYAQDLTVTRLAKSRRFDDIETLLEAHKIKPKITQEPYLATLIRSYGRAGMFDHALKTYNEMEELGTPRSAVSFNALLTACNVSKHFERVPQLFDEMPQRYGFSPDKISYGILARSYCELGSFDLAIGLIKQMEEKGVEINPVIFSTIMGGLYKNGKVDEASDIWNEMVKRGCSPDVTAHNVRLMRVQGGPPETVKKLIDEMSNAGLKPDAISYNYLMTSYCKSGMIDEAIRVYEGLKENGCPPNAATFRTLIFHLCRSERFERGFEVFKESVRARRIPDFNTLKHLVTGLVENSKTEEAKEICLILKNKVPPNFLNAWKKLEEELGLVAAAPSKGPSETEKAKV